jgi:hypothetical protein
MCWSFQVSLLSFLIGTIVGTVLYQRSRPYDKTIALLIFFYSFMQLWEAMMWWGIDNNKPMLNLTSTRLAYITLWTHVLAIGLGLYIESNYSDKLVLYIGGLLVAYGLFYLITRWKSFTESKPTSTSKGHLVWGFDPTFYMIVFITAILVVLFKTQLKYTWPALIFFLVSYTYSYISNPEAIGSYWCWTAAVFSFIPLLVNN